jgi:hypothetical protein
MDSGDPQERIRAVLVFHPYRVQTHSTSSTSWSGAEPTADTSNALTVGPAGNLTHCAHLTVSGSHNKVVADATDTIDTDGSGNHVVYHTGTAQITVRGSDHTVNKG